MYLLFLAYPIAEIALFVLVGRLSGSWEWVVLPTAATSFLGYALLRGQRRWQVFGQNNFTQNSIENYLFGNLGAFALLLPGFISDLFGLIVIVPWTRRLLLAAFKLVRFDVYQKAQGPFSVFRTYSFNSNRNFSDQDDDEFFDDDNTIDVEARNADSDDQSQSDDAIEVEFTVRD
ncbi:MAG: FxsA family protein [Thermoguttaceae bacterium]|nr:FxsA family protein [Thermoguttaceae bacterium]